MPSPGPTHSGFFNRNRNATAARRSRRGFPLEICHRAPRRLPPAKRQPTKGREGDDLPDKAAARRAADAKPGAKRPGQSAFDSVRNEVARTCASDCRVSMAFGRRDRTRRRSRRTLSRLEVRARCCRTRPRRTTSRRSHRQAWPTRVQRAARCRDSETRCRSRTADRR